MENDLMAKDPVKILQTLSQFSKTLSHAQYKRTLAHLGDRDRNVIDFVLEGLVVEGLYGDFPPEIKGKLEALQKDEGVVAAAQILYREISHMERYRDTYQINIKNSVIAGDCVLTNVKGGTIDSSIIAGGKALGGSDVNVRNSYVVTPKGIKFIQDGAVGNPTLYDTVPLSITGSKALFGAMNHYRIPAVERHFKTRGY